MLALVLALTLQTTPVALAGAPAPVAQLVPNAVTESLAAVEQLTNAKLAEHANQALTEIRAMNAAMQAIGTDKPECTTASRHTFKLLAELAVKSREALTPMLERNDRIHATAEFRKLIVALLRARSMYARAYECAYDEASSGGASAASSEYLGHDYGSDLLLDTLESLDAGEAPPEASPFI